MDATSAQMRCDCCGLMFKAGERAYLLVSVTIDDPQVFLSFTGIGTSGTNRLVHRECLGREPPARCGLPEPPPGAAVQRTAILDGFSEL